MTQLEPEPYTYTDADLDTLEIWPTRLLRVPTGSVSMTITEGGRRSAVYVVADRVEELVTAVRAAAGKPATVSSATDRATLRDRIRCAVCEAEGFGWDTDMLEPDEYGEVADAVLAVLPEPVEQATVLREAADEVRHVLETEPVVDRTALEYRGLVSAALMADGAQQGEDLASADNPTPLRWGLNDVLWGDDDTVTVLLSGPDGEPYGLELTPDRATVLRQDLAGPDGHHEVTQ
ncbi:hypothetical protein OG285_32450 [Streptomyces sp. NBC_01471]|uniref:hypothetical protein n=1 Tax=Streptomyces sp. NBC_01471 TaxID=2903879 RepID=UPI003253CD7E